MVGPIARREAVGWLADARHESAAGLSRDRAEHGDVALSATAQCDERRACWRGCRRTRRCAPRFGYRRLHILLEREGFVVNHKRVHRLYRAAGLQVRRRRRKRLTRAERVPLPAPESATASAGRWTSWSTRWPTAAASAR